MKNNMFRKGLVLGIIILFVGAGVIPSTVGVKKEKTIITTIESPGYIQDLIDKINGVEKNNILLSVMDSVLSRLKNYDEDYLEKQISKMKSFLKTRFFKKMLNSLNLNEILDEKLESFKNLLFTNNYYENYNKENAKNTVTVRACTLNGVEEITREMSAEEVTKLSILIDHMKESLRIIDSNTTSNYEKKQAHKIIDNVYHYLRNLELLPAYMEKQEAIDLITGQYGKQIYEDLRWSKFSELMKNDKKREGSEGNINNTWCSVSCNGYAHITYLAIDPWLIGLGSIPRLILISPILILLLFELPLMSILLPIYVALIILLYMGYPVEEIIIFIENIFNIIVSTLEVFLWAFEPGYKLMYLHHKFIPERRIVGCASMTNGNLSVTTKGLFGSKNGIVSSLEITGFLGLWIESNIQEPEFPDYEFTSTLSCNGYAISVRTPPLVT